MRILILLFLLHFFCHCSTPTNENNEQITAQDSIPPKDSIHRIKLTFVGDIMQHGNQICSAAGCKENMKSRNMDDFNYEPCFRYIKPILDRADLAIGNLELTLSNKGRYKGYPMFKSPDRLASDLKESGFDMLTTCNNHSNDGFLYGINHTIDVLDSLQILHTGTFKNQEEREKTYPFIYEKEVDGTTFKLAFINYTYATNGINTPEPAVVNMIEDSTILKDIDAAKQAKPDMIIAIMHWGHEYWLNESKEQKRLTQMLWDNGVDVVIGAHPHVIEPVKTDTIYNADSSKLRETLVVYSLGNFISNQTQPNTDIGLIFELELVKNSNTNHTVIGQHNYIFAWRYIHKKSKGPYECTYSAIPVTAFENNTSWLGMSKTDSVRMIKTTQNMRKHLEKWQSKERKVSFKELGTIQPLDSIPLSKKAIQ